MSTRLSQKISRQKSRQRRVRKSIERTERARLTVHRSARHITAQIDDPVTGRTLGSVTTRSKKVVSEGGTGNIEAAKLVGAEIARLAKEKDITEVVFNRNGFLYHGRVKALAEAAREAGLQF